MKPVTPPFAHSHRGFGAIAAIVVLVVMASLAAAIVRLGHASQTGMAQDILSARAWAAAQAGTDWGLYQALKGSWTTCSNASQTLNFNTDAGVVVTVTCTSSTYNEGESAGGTANTYRVYTLNAVACNSTACPDNTRAVQPGYIERRRQVQAMK